MSHIPKKVILINLIKLKGGETMKKLLILALALLLAVILVACGQSDTPAGDTGKTSETAAGVETCTVSYYDAGKKDSLESEHLGSLMLS